MDQFYKDSVEKIRDAAEKDIQKITGETGGEKIYVAALVTDSFIIQSRPSPPGRCFPFVSTFPGHPVILVIRFFHII